MSTICLSHAPILRCVGVTHTFAVTLLIPPVLALFFGLSLLFVRRNGDKKRLLLVGEGITYFILCLLDSLAEVVPATQFSISTFKALDMTVGVLSDLPIFLYCLFLLLFVRSTLIRSFSQASQRISYLVFLLLIPAILVLNVCASFIGISYAQIDFGDASKATVGVGFKSPHSMWVWTFLNGFTLVLLGLIQFLVFLLAFVQVVKSKASRPGLTILAFGLFIGAVECMVGYGPNTIPVVYVRRVMHSLARALIIVGMLIGFGQDAFSETASQQSSLRSRIGSPMENSVVRTGGEGESILEKPMEQVQVDPAVQLERAKTIIRDMQTAVFNPFEQPRTPNSIKFSATSTKFPLASVSEKPSNPFEDQPQVIVTEPQSIADLSRQNSRRSVQPRSSNDDDNTPMQSPVAAARPRPRAADAVDNSAQRVTLHYDSRTGVAPHLEMRLSGIDLPSPSEIMSSIARFDAMRPNSDPAVPAVLASRPRLPRTNTVAGSLAHLRQQYAQEADKSGDMWYPFRGSPSSKLQRSATAGHTRNQSSLGTPSSTLYSTASDLEAGDPANDPRTADSSSRHSRTQTIDSTPRPRSRHLSVVSGTSYMSDASDWVKDLAPRFPDIPPMPVPSRVVSTMAPFSGYNTPDAFRARTPEPLAMLNSPFADVSEETEEDAAHAVRGVRSLPLLDTGLNAPSSAGPSSSASASSSDYTESAASTRRMGALDVPMSAVDAEYVEVPGTARPPMPPVPMSAQMTDSPASYRAFDRSVKSDDLVSIKSVGRVAVWNTPVATPATAGRDSVPIEHFVFNVRSNVHAPSRESTYSTYSDDIRPGFAQ